MVDHFTCLLKCFFYNIWLFKSPFCNKGSNATNKLGTLSRGKETEEKRDKIQIALMFPEAQSKAAEAAKLMAQNILFRLKNTKHYQCENSVYSFWGVFLYCRNILWRSPSNMTTAIIYFMIHQVLNKKSKIKIGKPQKRYMIPLIRYFDNRINIFPTPIDSAKNSCWQQTYEGNNVSQRSSLKVIKYLPYKAAMFFFFFFLFHNRISVSRNTSSELWHN